ncbi:hypothetical protein [Halothece sp. PCC 7418]|nr:hypothetical protein [Halothece sp. PCC 7418]
MSISWIKQFTILGRDRAAKSNRAVLIFSKRDRAAKTESDRAL